MAIVFFRLEYNDYAGWTFAWEHPYLSAAILGLALYTHTVPTLQPLLPSNFPTPKGSPANPPNSVPDPLEQFDVLPLIEHLQFTNLALILLFNLILLTLILVAFRANGRTTYEFTLRSLYQLVRSMARENIYLQKQQYFAILFYLFAVLLLANLVGLIPYSFTVTSSFVVTFFIALMHFLGVNTIFSSEYGMKSFGMFLPSGAPTVIAPFLVFIEAVSYVARVFSLSIRLFANMMSGHALLKILIGFAWTMLSSPIMAAIAILPWVIVTAISYLELLIAFLQAYVFVILVALYINDAVNLHD